MKLFNISSNKCCVILYAQIAICDISEEAQGSSMGINSEL